MILFYFLCQVHFKMKNITACKEQNFNCFHKPRKLSDRIKLYIRIVHVHLYMHVSMFDIQFIKVFLSEFLTNSGRSNHMALEFIWTYFWILQEQNYYSWSWKYIPRKIKILGADGSKKFHFSLVFSTFLVGKADGCGIPLEILWKFRPELRSLKQPASPIHIFFSFFFQDAEIEPLNSKDPSELV